MIQGRSVVALIPARGGSKGIHNKNIVDLAGKPLIAHTIEQSYQSGYIDKVVVSTDDSTIAEVSRSYKADVPFLRPAGLALDETPTSDVITHFIDHFQHTKDFSVDIIILLQPTSPLRKVVDIDNAIELYVKAPCDSVISVCECGKPLHWFKNVNKGGYLEDVALLPKDISRRQEADKLYLLNGAIYVFDRETFIRKKKVHTDASIPYVMPIQSSVDIDTPQDLALAAFYLSLS